MLTESVTYRQLEGYPNYWIGDDGSVFSRNRMKFLKNFDDGIGYRRVNLCSQGRVRPHYIHRLLLLAFVGPCPDGMEACHWNDKRADNRLENLRWGTQKDNKADMRRNGISAARHTLPDFKGEKNPYCKLTEKDVASIRSLDGTMKQRDIAKMFGISQATTWAILRKRAWSHI